MFDLYDTDRLTEWKKFRNRLETATNPLLLVVDLWSKAPFVNQYLDHKDPKSWPDPWHLILDSKYDNLAIILGIYYTLLLTDRFSKENFKIYMLSSKNNEPNFCLCINDKSVINLYYGQISSFADLEKYQYSKIYERMTQQ